MAKFTDRLKHAWNAFVFNDKHPDEVLKATSSNDFGGVYTYQPSRNRMRVGNDRSIIGAIYTRLGIDVAAISIKHVRVDSNGQYLQDMDTALNDCLTIAANIDQPARAFMQDVAMTLFDQGVAAIVPVDTTLNPLSTGGYDVNTMRVGRVMQWKAQSVCVRVYNDQKGIQQDIWLPKNMVAIVENPLYSVMNETSSTLQRLIRKLNLLDAVDEQSASGNLDIIIQLPYVIKTEQRRQEAEKRLKEIEFQLKGSQYGIAYTDGTEKITQLNRPVENNLMDQVSYLTTMLYGQLGITDTIMNGTADELTMLNYYNRTIEPILAAITQALKRTFLTKTARSQGQSVIYLKSPFDLVPVADLAEIADKFRRNEILSGNEMRSIIGFPPSSDPKANQLLNPNLPIAQTIMPQDGVTIKPPPKSPFPQIPASDTNGVPPTVPNGVAPKPSLKALSMLTPAIPKELLNMVPDFSGYATKSGLKCSDGRTITPQAFKNADGVTVPLVWQHQHNSAENVLGHVVLSHRADGVWADGYFNDTEQGKNARTLVEHKDVKALSIYANGLIQKGLDVLHGVIREVSLVLSGANPGAFIENVNLAHGVNVEDVESEAIIYTDEEIQHATPTAPATKVALKKPPMPTPSQKPTPADPDPDHDGDNDLFDPKDGGLDPSTASAQQVLDTLTPEQQKVVYALIGAAMQQDGDADGQTSSATSNDQKGNTPVGRNVFDQTSDDTVKKPGATLSHADVQEIFQKAHKGGSLKGAVDEYALEHGIDDISTLFPYDQAVTDTPDWISRRMEWVAAVLAGTRKTPFSRIRSWTADLTLDEARAKGYVKASLKKEQYFAVAKRITTPQTIYKKQKLDRDDILDITDFDVVAWLQTEMRVMLDEELARAILVGDGREIDDSDKISPSNVRPILGDDELYVTNLNVDLSDDGSTADEIVDAVVNGMRFYRGSGNPVMYTTLPYMSKMLLAKDTLGRRLYATKVELAAAMGVTDIIPCEVLEETDNLIGIIVNLADYTVGADKGGEVNMFDFFDIDYNQFKYLMETRVSGAMTKYKGALTIMEFTGAGGMLPDPTPPSFVTSTGVVTIPTTSHVSYAIVDDSDGSVGSALTAGAQTAIDPGASVHIRALAASTYSFQDDANEDWTFIRDPAS